MLETLKKITDIVGSPLFFGILMEAMLVVCIGSILLHGPWFKATKRQKKAIHEKGLIHFTDKKIVQLIKENGFKGSPADTGWPETLLGNLVWFYPYEEGKVQNRYQYVMSKRRARTKEKEYNACLKVTGLTYQDIEHMYRRHGFNGDNAIIYRGNWLKNVKVEEIPIPE